jgi:hypothetical protein
VERGLHRFVQSGVQRVGYDANDLNPAVGVGHSSELSRIATRRRERRYANLPSDGVTVWEVSARQSFINNGDCRAMRVLCFVP